MTADVEAMKAKVAELRKRLDEVETQTKVEKAKFVNALSELSIEDLNWILTVTEKEIANRRENA